MKMNISLPVEIDIPDCAIEEIRNKAIDDFAEKLMKFIRITWIIELISEIAEQLKGGGVNE